ncbi:ethanolamine utilization protein EutJ [Pelolinea submarina]|nr:ethanolamine utilization protein EutJ [Pelolinea submarina]BBB47535.1 ethanolamine utilization protein EutJ [Pelolinea submarina]
MREHFDLGSYLQRARQTILPSLEEAAPLAEPPQGPLYVGADLGTAYLVLVVLDADRQVVAGEYQFAQVVKDGLVVDYMGAVDKLSAMKSRLEALLGRELTSAASAYPPGVPLAEVRATVNVVEAAGFTCSGLVDEPSAANYLLGVDNGAIVDIGGGTTGIAVIENGQVVYTADEATGGTHFTLVIAGAKDLSFEEAEEYKKDPSRQRELFPVLRPVMEKVASITARNLAGRKVEHITLVGGSACAQGMDRVVQQYTGIPTSIPADPLFVTPIGIALQQAYEMNSESE